MTSFSWFSGNSESSRKCTEIVSCRMSRGSERSEGGLADDSRALHLADGGPVVLDGVVLGRAVVPDGEAVRRPAPAHLVFGDRGAADQITQQVRAPRREVLAVAHIRRRVEVDEVGREAADEQ